MCFIRKIFFDRIDENVHKQFIRFGKGQFENRALASFRKVPGKVKANFSFEYANDIVELVSGFDGGKCSGVVLSKEDISGLMLSNKIKGHSETKQGGLFFKNNLDEQILNKEQIRKLVEKAYFCLLDIEGQGFILKTKKSLPKPGKSGEVKIDDKFCQLEISEKYWNALKECFFWDFLDEKKGKVSHNYIISEIIIPKGEKDFEKARIEAKRKGKIIRKISNGQEKVTEKEMVV